MALLEILSIIKIGCAVVGSSIATILLSKWLGKTKEEAEIVLNWEEIHEKRDKKLLAEIKRLEDKLDDIINQMEKERESHRKQILLWEVSDSKKASIIEDKNKIIAELMSEIEEKK